MKILIFLQGTIIMHRNAQGKPRQEIIEQVVSQEESVRDYNNYIPIGNAPQKIDKWVAQGAEVCYLSALTKNKKGRGDELVGNEGLKADKIILDRYNFPKGTIYHRESNEEYKDVVERIWPLPDILIEDDCESIGGEVEMTYPHLKQNLKDKIKSIPVNEFGGIDNLPDELKEWG
jgi:hypothetical protein